MVKGGDGAGDRSDRVSGRQREKLTGLKGWWRERRRQNRGQWREEDGQKGWMEEWTEQRNECTKSL